MSFDLTLDIKLKDTWRLGVLHVEYERLKKEQIQQDQGLKGLLKIQIIKTNFLNICLSILERLLLYGVKNLLL